MDLLMQVAEFVWPLLTAGAVQRIGELGTDETLTAARDLADRVTRKREASGDAPAPRTVNELRADLEAILQADPAARQQVTNIFKAPIFSENANFGIQNR